MNDDGGSQSSSNNVLSYNDSIVVGSNNNANSDCHDEMNNSTGGEGNNQQSLQSLPIPNHPVIIDQRNQPQFHQQHQNQFSKTKIPSPTPPISLASSSTIGTSSTTSAQLLNTEADNGIIYNGITLSEKSALSSTNSVRSDSPIITNGVGNHLPLAEQNSLASSINLLNRLLPSIDQSILLNSNFDENSQLPKEFQPPPAPESYQSIDSSLSPSSIRKQQMNLTQESSSSSTNNNTNMLYNIHSSSSAASSSSSSSALIQQYNRLQLQQRQQQQHKSQSNCLDGNRLGSPKTSAQQQSNQAIATNLNTVYHRALAMKSSPLNQNNHGKNSSSNPSALSSNRTMDTNNGGPNFTRPNNSSPIPQPPPLIPHRMIDVIPPPVPPISSSSSLSITNSTSSTNLNTLINQNPKLSSPKSSRSQIQNDNLNRVNDNLNQIKNYIKNQLPLLANSFSTTDHHRSQVPSLPSNHTPFSLGPNRFQALSYASSASSSSPQRGTSPISFTTNQSTNNANVASNNISAVSRLLSTSSTLNQVINNEKNKQHNISTTIPNVICSTSSSSSSSLSSSTTVTLTNGNQSIVNQVAQKLHNFQLNQQQSTATQSGTNQINTGSTNSLLSTYSGQSFAHSPPPSYAASSSSGRQSPTPTISSSSDYASIPMMPFQRSTGANVLMSSSSPLNSAYHIVGNHHNGLKTAPNQSVIGQSSSSSSLLQMKSSPISSNLSISINPKSSKSSQNLFGKKTLTNASSMSSLAMINSNKNNLGTVLPHQQNSPISANAKHSLQAWSARQAISQSPIIMQSVKSQQVQKPILQTAVAPILPPINVKTPVTAVKILTNQSTTTQMTLLITAATTTTTITTCSASNLSSSTLMSTGMINSFDPSSMNSTATNSVATSSTATKNPPPYPSGSSVKKCLDSVSTLANEGYHSTPPPPYPSGSHKQHSKQQQQPNNLSNRMHLISKTLSQSKLSLSAQSQNSDGQATQCSDVSDKSANYCTPPPPPYSMSLSVSQNDSIAQIISGWTGNDQQTIQQMPVQIPTTDPPSYASSMAVLAAQRAQVISPHSLVLIKSDQQNGNIITVTSSSSSTTVTTSSTKCDLVNTVESICVSQISVLQTEHHQRPAPNCAPQESVGPPLPPKPSSSGMTQQNSIPPPLPPPHFNVVSTSKQIDEESNNTTVAEVMKQKNYQASSATPSSHEDSQNSTGTLSIVNQPSVHLISDNINLDEDCQIVSDTNDVVDNGLENDESNDLIEENEDGTKKRTHQSPIPTRKNLSKAKEKERRDFKVRNYSPAAFKFYMEQHVENLIKSQQQRERRRQQLESEMKKACLSEEDQLGLRQMLYQKESNYIRLRRAKMDRSMFKKIKTIGVGAFGEVALVRKIDANLLYAMKTLRKDDVLKRNQVAHVKAERDILAEADCEWVVKLYYSFQDERHLYFVMDYIPGGDLMSLLIKFGIFEEPLAR